MPNSVIATGFPCATRVRTPSLKSIGDLGRPVEIHADDVEGTPVDALERYGGVGDLAAELRADTCHGVAEEFVHAGTELADLLPQAIPVCRVQQEGEPVGHGVAWQEPLVHEAQLGADDEHDLGAPSP